MKVLITAAEIKNRALRGEKSIIAGPGSIITPSARDTAREMGLEILPGDGPPAEVRNQCQAISGDTAEVSPSPELVANIVQKVLAMLGANSVAAGPVVERHPSGVRLVRGETVVGEPFPTGRPGDRVFLKDALPVAESPNMCAGFITMEKSSFNWELRYDEYDYIIDGELDITVDGEVFHGRAGDVFFIPRGTAVTFGSRGSAKFFYVTYPANWRDQ